MDEDRHLQIPWMGYIEYRRRARLDVFVHRPGTRHCLVWNKPGNNLGPFSSAGIAWLAPHLSELMTLNLECRR